MTQRYINKITSYKWLISYMLNNTAFFCANGGKFMTNIKLGYESYNGIMEFKGSH